MHKLAFVVQRYGNGVVGGAETLARDMAERAYAAGLDVTVITTTASDYISWTNHFPAGESILKGVRILRFPVEVNRDIDSFNRFSELFFQQAEDERDEEAWFRQQGPHSPALIEALGRLEKEFDLFVFFTYLYEPTVDGVMQIKDKPVILFPTAHDELPLYLNRVRRMMERVDSFFFLTQAEQDLVTRVFSLNARLTLVRTGIPQIPATADLFRKKYGLIKPYMLYAGRIERGKGLEVVIEAYRELRQRRLIDWILIGRQLMDLPREDGIRYLGYVSESEKRSAFAGAVFSVQPSPMESLSITTLESFVQKIPIVANANCAVLREHVELGGGGLVYRTPAELAGHAEFLIDHLRQRRSMGRDGHNYVRKYFDWERVMELFEREVNELIRSDFDT